MWRNFTDSQGALNELTEKHSNTAGDACVAPSLTSTQDIN